MTNVVMRWVFGFMLAFVAVTSPAAAATTISSLDGVPTSSESRCSQGDYLKTGSVGARGCEPNAFTPSAFAPDPSGYKYDNRPSSVRGHLNELAFYGYYSSANRFGPAVDSSQVHRVVSGLEVDLVAPSKTGGIGPVRVGQAGEAAVRGAYDIGPKATVSINGRTRILDGLTDSAVTEVKNVQSLSLTTQIQDNIDYAAQTGRDLHIYVRPDTYLTGPLRDAIVGSNGAIELRSIPQ